jgi:hypothetical protein
MINSWMPSSTSADEAALAPASHMTSEQIHRLSFSLGSQKWPRS